MLARGLRSNLSDWIGSYPIGIVARLIATQTIRAWPLLRFSQLLNGQILAQHVASASVLGSRCGPADASGVCVRAKAQRPQAHARYKVDVKKQTLVALQGAREK